MTPTITPEQAAALADLPPDVTAYLAVKGEPCPGSRLCRSGAPCAFCHREFQPEECVLLEGYWYLPGHVIPPADLAALVEQRCETCRHSSNPGEVLHLLHVNDAATDIGGFGPCPAECHDGKPLHTIQHECQHRFCSLDKRGQGIEWTCDHWQNDGLIPAPGLWTYDALLPVVNSINPNAPSHLLFDHVYQIGRNWRRFNTFTQSSEPITVYGTPAPGHFVLAVTRRTP